MPGGEINAELDDLDFEMAADFFEILDILVDIWTNCAANAGQESIIENILLPAAIQWLNNASIDWPYGDDADGYYAAMWDSYDSEVLARAFSDTIDESYNEISDPFFDAYGSQEEHDSLCESIGAFQLPHSLTRLFGGGLGGLSDILAFFI